MTNCCNISSAKVPACGLNPLKHNGYVITSNQAKKLITKGEIYIKRNNEKIKLVLGIDLAPFEINEILKNYRG